MNSGDQKLIRPVPPHLRSQPFSEVSVLDPSKKPQAPGHRLLLNWPIARRLLLGFLAAAVIAAAAASITGIQRASVLQNQTHFYQKLVASNTQLTRGDGVLQLMNTNLNKALAVAQSGTSSQTETIQNIQGLAKSYDTILTSYVQRGLIDKNPDQKALITEAGSTDLIVKQKTLANSALITWHDYRDAQKRILTNIENSNQGEAQQLNSTLATPTHNNALSALRALIQSEGDLADSVLAIEGVEERNQLIMTLVGAFIAFLGVGIVGWFVSGTIVPRLQDLRNVVQSVEDGRFDSRAVVAGKDEIAQVAASVNTMLNTIVGLLDEARQQRDALTQAADHLFSDMRVVGAGDLRVNASVSNDPVGMLANAFNLTVGRFRRLILRTRTSIQQIDVVFRQEIKHAESSIAVAKRVLSSNELESSTGRGNQLLSQNTLARLHQVRNLMQLSGNQGTEVAMNAVLAQIEQAYHLTQQLEGKSIPEVSNIQRALLKAGQEMQTMHKNIASAISVINAIEGEIVASAQESSPEKRHSMLSTGSATVSKHELARFYLEFAQEIVTATSKLRSIIQEVQVSLTTFQVEVP